MKKTLVILFAIFAGFCFGKENSILKNFKPFPTPRTNYRPGTVYRVDAENVNYFVQDVKQIKSYISKEGALFGRMSFSKEELLTLLNIEFAFDLVIVEVIIKDAQREFNEQTNLDKVLWNDDVVDDLIVDDSSRYFIIRETVSSKEITFRFTQEAYNNIVTGSSNLKANESSGDGIIDYPYSTTKKYKEPKRIFYLDQEIGENHYGD